MSEMGVIQRHAELSGLLLRPKPTLDAPEPPSYLPDAPWWAFRVRGSVTPWLEMMNHGFPGRVRLCSSSGVALKDTTPGLCNTAKVVSPSKGG